MHCCSLWKWLSEFHILLTSSGLGSSDRTAKDWNRFLSWAMKAFFADCSFNEVVCRDKVIVTANICSSSHLNIQKWASPCAIIHQVFNLVLSCIWFYSKAHGNRMRISAHAHSRWLNTLQLLPLKLVLYPKSFQGKKNPNTTCYSTNKVKALEMGSSMFKGPVGLGASSPW